MLSFLVIGPMRCGTSWTHLWLREHPQLWLPQIKELQFWSWLTKVEDEKAFRRFITVYEAVYEDREPRVCGEVSPDYATIPPYMIDEVRRLNENLKIVLIVRDPVDRAFSQMKMMLSNREGVKAGQFGSLDEDRFLAHVDEAADWIDYPTIYRNWSAVFPPEQILVLPFDNIAQSPDDFLARIATHIGIQNADFWRSNEVQKTLHEKRNHIDEVDMPVNIRRILLDRLQEKARESADMFGFNADPWLNKHRLLIRIKGNQMVDKKVPNTPDDPAGGERI